MSRHPFLKGLCFVLVNFMGMESRADPSAQALIVIEAVKFTPEITVVKRGAWVQWTNKDPFPHTVTSPGTFDSHEIPAGGTWKHRMSEVGEFHYVCTLHSNMSAILRVEK
jgi:plastocyanin